MDVKLVIFKRDGSKKEIAVKPGRYLVGRRPEAELRIPLPSVSRDHCEIVHDGQSLSVRDLGSSNGTFKNYERVKQAVLGPGDLLGVGSFLMTVQIDGKPSAINAPADEEGHDVMMETPPQGAPMSSAPAVSKPRPAVKPAEPDLDETVAKSSPVAGMARGGDDSSVFEFDFDFEDEDRPKL